MRAIFVITIALSLASANAMFMYPNNAPLDRVIANLESRIEANPDEMEARYALGRAHSLAFTRAIDHVPIHGRLDVKRPIRVVRDDGLPGAGPNMDFRDDAITAENRLSFEQRIGHLVASIDSYYAALKRYDLEVKGYQNRNEYVHISLAYIIEIGAPYALDAGFVPGLDADAEVNEEDRRRFRRLVMQLDHEPDRAEATRTLISEGVPAAAYLLNNVDHDGAHNRQRIADVLADWWRELAIEHYLEAFDRTLDDDMCVETLHRYEGLSGLVSFEAGHAYLRLVESRGRRPDETDTVERVREGLKNLESVERSNWITPIIFPLDEDRSLGSLLAPGTTVNFDLDGTARDQTWPWVNPDTAILVWDPDHTGEITSGRQLFGSVTWWLMFDNGYRALDALDDDRDGRLTGDELEGIAVWIDANSNGVSDPGEVRPVTEHRIAALSTRATTTEDGCPANHTGVRFTDARTLPTYDWITASVETKP